MSSAKVTQFNSINDILVIIGHPFVCEYKFHDTRHWRFDYAIPSKRIAFEYEGIYGKGKSRHTTVKGYRNDCEKYNEAALYGWTVLRFTNDMLKDGTAIDAIERVLDIYRPQL